MGRVRGRGSRQECEGEEKVVVDGKGEREMSCGDQLKGAKRDGHAVYVLVPPAQTPTILELQRLVCTSACQ